RATSISVRVPQTGETAGLHLQTGTDGAVRLRWDPVTQDIEGRSESVDHYVIYRYDRRGTFPEGPLVRVGESHTTAYIDRGGTAADKKPTAGPPLLETDAPHPPP